MYTVVQSFGKWGENIVAHCFTKKEAIAIMNSLILRGWSGDLYVEFCGHVVA